MTALLRPELRPANPYFSSGPCAKPPNWQLSKLSNAPLGRSHRAAIGRKKLNDAIEAVSYTHLTLPTTPYV